MLYSGMKKFLQGFALLTFCIPVHGFPTATQNDPYPFFSSYYPYSFLMTRQKANLMRFDYTYAENRFRFSVSGFAQHANCAKNSEWNTVNLGDLNGRWNMLGLFYDPKLRDVLYTALGGVLPDPACAPFIEDPRLVDPNKEFGFFSVPLRYRKHGVRFETEILLIDRCFYGVGLRVQWGIADIRQTVKAFEDFTCQALGIACPAALRGPDNRVLTTPVPKEVTGITPPFINPTAPLAVGEPLCPVLREEECVPPLQPFQPCDT
ncbi:hypothetical protein H0W26_02570, partial [Candidatus Dependentiae bacterium]|nr:hypothetical protein [Candidatus Dependentiae bacterium]